MQSTGEKSRLHSKPGNISRLELRRAETADAMAVARVQVRSWQAAYRGLMPDDFLAQLRPEDRAKRYDFWNLDPVRPQTIIAVERGEIRGLVTTAPAQESNMPDFGELCGLYVDPDHWGRGIGVALVSAARARLLDHGFRKAILWVLASNVRAQRFYRKDQWAPDGGQRTEEKWGFKVNDVRYRRNLEGA